MSPTLPETFLEFLQRCDTFDDLPGDLDVASQANISWNQVGPYYAGFSRVDFEILKLEEYLRTIWPSSEAMPEPFDADGLRAALQDRLKSHDGEESTDESDDNTSSENGFELHDSDTEGQRQGDEQASDAIRSDEANISDNPVIADVTLTKPLDLGERLKDQDSNTIIQNAVAEDTTQVSQGSDVKSLARETSFLELESKSEPVERISTPRMGRRSKPPLSRSAFAGAAQPYPKGGSLDKPPCMTLVNYPRAPKYFPFKSKAMAKK
ncbi:hypothetical protein F5Y11DRAFT_337607 [Daldinia sp. FL1419]|nr:hypothetical protein F5Y11DRAFT_337607 [Daldinia sp. FL1419]